MNALIRSIEAEYLRYKALAETALAQVPEPSLSQPGPAEGNSLATICWHLSGNLKSRFTDFLTSDGEKPWRNREEEFSPRTLVVRLPTGTAAQPQAAVLPDLRLYSVV
jgi:hypothetical protein